MEQEQELERSKMPTTALAETVNGLLITEGIRHQGPWKGVKKSSSQPGLGSRVQHKTIDVIDRLRRSSRIRKRVLQ